MPEPVDKDACQLLDADHLAVKHLFVEYARLAYAPNTGTSGDRGAIAAEICDELTVHAQIEEEIFYPALREAVSGAANMVAEAEQEHQEARQLIAQIREQLAAPGPTLDQLVADLARAVEDHVKEERDELFPKARSAPGLNLAEVGDRLRQRQRELVDEAELPGGRSRRR